MKKKNFFNSKIFYLLFSLFLAVILFVNANLMKMQNNGLEKTAEQYDTTLNDIPVQIKVDDKKYYVSDYDTEVSVHLSSYNRLRLKAEEEDVSRAFKVVADLTNMTEGTKEVPLHIEGLNNSVEAKIKPQKISVTIDKKVTKELDVQPNIKEEQISEGFSYGDIEIEPKKVAIITGKKILKEIDHLTVELPEKTVLDHDYTNYLPVKAVNVQAQQLSIQSAPKEVKLSVKVYKPSKQVELSPESQGELAKNVERVDISLNVNQVRISGLKSEIDKINILRLPIKVSDITEKKSYTLNLNKFYTSYSVEPQTVTVTLTPHFKSENIESSKSSSSSSTESSQAPS
jgi:YbbR domain-containing protein